MNYGKKITKIVVCDLLKASLVLNQVMTNGQVFRVDFIKRTDASVRTMVCRCGVRSKTTGKGSAYSFAKKGLLSVWEFATGYRAIPIDGILAIKQAGVWYTFEEIQRVKSREYNVTSLKDGRRTVCASTSPLFAQ